MRQSPDENTLSELYHTDLDVQRRPGIDPEKEGQSQRDAGQSEGTRPLLILT